MNDRSVTGDGNDAGADARERRLVDWAVLLTGSPRKAIAYVEDAIVEVLASRRRAIDADPDLAVYVSVAARYLQRDTRQRRWRALRHAISPHYVPRAGDAIAWPESVRPMAAALGRLEPHERAAALLHIVGATQDHLSLALGLHPAETGQTLRLAAIRLTNELGTLDDLVGLDEDTVSVSAVGPSANPWGPQ